MMLYTSDKFLSQQITFNTFLFQFETAVSSTYLFLTNPFDSLQHRVVSTKWLSNVMCYRGHNS